MASRTLNQFEVGPRSSSLQHTAAYVGPLPASSIYVAPAFTRLGGGLEISRAKALGGAKGAMSAIGFEAAAALCVYSIWFLWHII
jgi:hypothetical protein